MDINQKAVNIPVVAGGDTILKILYDYYVENEATDSREAQRAFKKLNLLLRELILEDYDQIWDTSMKLCCIHERRGFDAGFRMGINLTRELEAPGRRKDS